MLTIRKSQDRGHANHGWLDSYHTFSFGHYYDPRHRGFRDLLVINEDVVAPSTGFRTHPHDNMEIITYIVSGQLEHKDSTGTGSVIRAGDVQRMSAGSGIRHSEMNPSPHEPVHLLQIWILPKERDITPGYAEAHFPLAERRNRLRPIVTPDGAEGSLSMNQDSRVFASILGEGKSLTVALPAGRHAWVQLVKGSLTVNGLELKAGDGLAVTDESELHLTASEEAEFLLFELV